MKRAKTNMDTQPGHTGTPAVKRAKTGMDTQPGHAGSGVSGSMVVRVVSQDCLVAAQELLAAGCSSVAVLNMANAYSPGGGYTTGAGIRVCVYVPSCAPCASTVPPSTLARPTLCIAFY